MIVYEITKEYATAFDDFVAKYILAQIDKPGFNTLGVVSLMGDEHYGSGLLQYYVGPLIEKDTARITWISVPEEEQGESNAWSLLSEMMDRTETSGIKRVEVALTGEYEKELKEYFYMQDFTDRTDTLPLTRTTISELFTEKLLAVPETNSLCPISKASVSEVRRILQSLPQEDLNKMGISVEANVFSLMPQISYVYHDSNTDGILLANTVPEGGVILKLCRAIGSNPVKATLEMVGALGRKLTGFCISDTPVYIPLVNPNTEAALKTMNPNIKLHSVWKGELINE